MTGGAGLWTLLVWVYSGSSWTIKSDSVALQAVPGFTSRASCEAARASEQVFGLTQNARGYEIRTACVEIK